MTISRNHPAFNSYRRRLRGEKLPQHESNPEAGFYRYKSRGVDTVATIAPDRDEEPWNLVCYVGPDRREMNPVEVWAYIAGRHIAPDVAQAVLTTGKWPGQVPRADEVAAEAKVFPAEQLIESPGAVVLSQVAGGGPFKLSAVPEKRIEPAPIGDNSEKAGVGPIEKASAYLEEVGRFYKRIKPSDDAPAKIDSELLSNMAANFRDELKKFVKPLEVAHKEEKQPYLDKGREIDEKYLRLVDRIEAARVQLGAPLKAYLDEQTRKANELAAAVRKKAEEEAEAKRKAAIAAAKKRNDEETAEKIAAIPVEALIAPVAAAPKVAAGGQVGRKTTLKKETTYVIEDYELALGCVKDNAEVRAAVQLAVNRLRKAGMPVPGVKDVEGTKL